MRESSDRKKIEEFMNSLGEKISELMSVYFTGGATAVLLGFRTSTIDVDIKFEPDLDQMYKAIQDLKEKLQMNIELASPDHFIPPLPQWKERSIFVEKVGEVSFYHYDLYSQVLSKIERGWHLDMEDAENFVKHSVDLGLLSKLFRQIEDKFIQYPGVDLNQLKLKLAHFKNEIRKE